MSCVNTPVAGSVPAVVQIHLYGPAGVGTVFVTSSPTFHVPVVGITAEYSVDGRASDNVTGMVKMPAKALGV